MTPLRKRLMNPPNAVPDTGIDLRRPAANRISFNPRDITKPKPYPGHWFWFLHDNTVETIIETCSEVFRVGIEDIKGTARHRPLIHYRMATMAICCHLSTLSLTRIGKRFGKCDHTSVLNANKKMASHMTAVAAELPADASPIEWAQAMKRRIDL
jgi:hypothetical protein